MTTPTMAMPTCTCISGKLSKGVLVHMITSYGEGEAWAHEEVLIATLHAGTIMKDECAQESHTLNKRKHKWRQT